MSQIDPLQDFASRSEDDARERGIRKSEVKHNALDAIRSFFEDISVSDIYSKENPGPESYIQPGHPCHGGYENVDPDRQ